MITLLSLIIFMVPTGTAGAAAPERLAIVAGTTELIKIQGVTDIIAGDQDIVVPQLVQPSQLALRAKQQGRTEVILLKQDGSHRRIVVTVRDEVTEQAQLEQAWLLSQFPQLRIERQEGIAMLVGQAPQAAEPTINEFLARYPALLNQVQWLPPESPVMIELHVSIAEVKRQYLRQLGVNWPQQIDGPVFGESTVDSLLAPFEITTSIDMLEREGHARLLAEPKVVASSGGAAEFLVGGEIPIPQVVAQGMQDVQFREYGIALKISPQINLDGSISTEVLAEMSSIDPATSVNGIPGILTRRVSSHVTGPSGQAITLSGLINHEQSSQSDQFPFLHDLPILGRLFSSAQFRNAETELVVVVTPYLSSELEQEQQQQQHSARLLQAFYEASNCVGLIDGS